MVKRRDRNSRTSNVRRDGFVQPLGYGKRYEEERTN